MKVGVNVILSFARTKQTLSTAQNTQNAKRRKRFLNKF